MAFKEISVEKIAQSFNVNLPEIREKQRLIAIIVKERKAKKISQSSLAKKLGVSQARIAQIESGVGTSKVTFDVLLNVLFNLGFDFKIQTRKAA